MDDSEAGRCWERNTEACSRLMGLDLGGGEGHNARFLAQRGARMLAIDAAFDFGMAFMSLMDMPEPHAAWREACRVLRPGGFLQFSITHPCFDPPHRRLLRDGQGGAYAVEVGRCFEDTNGKVDQWLFSAAPLAAKVGLRQFQVPRFHWPLSTVAHASAVNDPAGPHQKGKPKRWGAGFNPARGFSPALRGIRGLPAVLWRERAAVGFSRQHGELNEVRRGTLKRR